jgi:hypothetical protein
MPSTPDPEDLVGERRSDVGDATEIQDDFSKTFAARHDALGLGP